MSSQAACGLLCALEPPLFSSYVEFQLAALAVPALVRHCTPVDCAVTPREPSIRCDIGMFSPPGHAADARLSRAAEYLRPSLQLHLKDLSSGERGLLRMCAGAIDFVYYAVLHILIVAFLARRLVTFLLRGSYSWLYMLTRLLIFTATLTNGWIKMVRLYLFDARILKNIEYSPDGLRKRHLLDLYLPQQSACNLPGGRGRPVCLFLCGGAWIIGYKMWSCLLTRGLSVFGIICVVPDYRNFPQGDIEDMMEDLETALRWTRANISSYGGDPDNIVLAGQSAGAHIACCSLSRWLERSQHREPADLQLDGLLPPIRSKLRVFEDLRNGRELSLFGGAVASPPRITQSITDRSRGDCSADDSIDELLFEGTDVDGDDVNSTFVSIASSASPLGSPLRMTLTPATVSAERAASATHADFCSIKLFVGISGPYNLQQLRAHLHSSGLDSSILDWICRGDVARYSPTLSLARAGGLRRLPPVALVHGCDDKSVPQASSLDLAALLAAGGAAVSTRLYKGWSHTDPILEGPMSGELQLFEDVATRILDACGASRATGAQLESFAVPAVLVSIARSVNPF